MFYKIPLPKVARNVSDDHPRENKATDEDVAVRQNEALITLDKVIYDKEEERRQTSMAREETLRIHGASSDRKVCRNKLTQAALEL